LVDGEEETALKLALRKRIKLSPLSPLYSTLLSLEIQDSSISRYRTLLYRGEECVDRDTLLSSIEESPLSRESPLSPLESTLLYLEIERGDTALSLKRRHLYLSSDYALTLLTA
jgi:hypothetical protein